MGSRMTAHSSGPNMMITKNYASRTLIVRPIGSFDALTADHYRQQLRSLIGEGYRFLIFDFEHTPYVNSSGLGLLVECFNKVHQLGGRVRVINYNEQILFLLEQTCLDRILLEAEEGDDEDQGEPLEAPAYDRLHALMSDEILVLNHLHRITERTLGLDDSAQIGRILIERLVSALQSPRGAIFYLNEAGNHLELVHWIENGQVQPIGALRQLPVKVGRLEHEILECGQATWHRVGKTEHPIDTLFEQMRFETLLATPIRAQRRQYGLLAVEAESGDEAGWLVHAAQPMVQTFANICGLALEKTALMKMLEQQNCELQQALARCRQWQHSILEAGPLAERGAIVSGLTHMLNNKLVPILGYSQVLMRQQDLPDAVRKRIESISQSGTQVGQVLEKLSTVTRPQDGKCTVDLNQLLHTVIDLMSFQSTRSGIELLVDAATGAPAIEGNTNQLLEAFVALLHTACTSFEPDQNRRWVHLITSANGTNLRVVVEDNGAVFDPADQEDESDPLASEEAIRHGRFFSYAIPRKVIERHHGKFSVEARREGGRRVIIDLPLPAQPTSPDPSQ